MALPEEYLGQFKDPEVRRKAAETRAKNRAEKQRRKEAAATGFGLSKLADPDNQALLINKLYDMALDPDPKLAMQAMKMLADMGVTKQPAEKAEGDEPQKAENMSIEDSVSILLRAQKDNEGKKMGDIEDEE